MFHVKLFRASFPSLFVDIDEEKGVFTGRAGVRGRHKSRPYGETAFSGVGADVPGGPSPVSRPLSSRLRCACRATSPGGGGKSGVGGKGVRHAGRPYGETAVCGVGADVPGGPSLVSRPLSSRLRCACRATSPGGGGKSGVGGKGVRHAGRPYGETAVCGVGADVPGGPSLVSRPLSSRLRCACRAASPGGGGKGGRSSPAVFHVKQIPTSCFT